MKQKRLHHTNTQERKLEIKCPEIITGETLKDFLDDFEKMSLTKLLDKYNRVEERLKKNQSKEDRLNDLYLSKCLRQTDLEYCP